MAIIFVYAGARDDHRIQSPYCITKNLYNYLKERTDVRYYRWDSTEDVDIGPDDILLGHPHYDPNTVVQKLFNKPCKAKFLIHPLHHGRPNDNLPFDHLARKADVIFSICGPYWYQTLEQSPFAHWKPKITRLDMAVDGNIFPYMKDKFNAPKDRRLVYVGSAAPNKNLEYLVKIMKALPNTTLHWYGGDSNHRLAKLPNVKTVGWVVLDKAIGKEICDSCDIMVSLSDSDANPTSLLETTSWGLIAACTKESGYYNDPMFTELYLNNFSKTVKTINNLLGTDTNILKQRSLINREMIETKYTWDNFCSTVWNGLQPWIQ